jgi:hypothetical protein
MAKPENASPPARTIRSATQPFGFEVRVRGRLDGAQWADWFGNLELTAARGETRLAGTLPDHAALYALLSRLRESGVPLLSVTVLDAAEERALHRLLDRQTLAVHLTTLAVYGLLIGGVTALAVSMSQAGWIDNSVAIALIFALLGIFAFVISSWTDFRPWRWLAFGLWPVALLVLLIYTSQVGLLPPGLVAAIILCGLAGGGIALAQYLHADRRRLHRLLESLPGRKPPAPAPPPAAPPPASPRVRTRSKARRKR